MGLGRTACRTLTRRLRRRSQRGCNILACKGQRSRSEVKFNPCAAGVPHAQSENLENNPSKGAIFENIDILFLNLTRTFKYCSKYCFVMKIVP